MIPVTINDARLLRRALALAVFLLAGVILAVTAYTLWRLRADAVANGLGAAAMHAHNVEDLLTQNLHVTELLAANILDQSAGRSSRSALAATYAAALSRAPFLRSISLLDAHDRIVASSNPDNVGMTIASQDFLPPSYGEQDVLRVGVPWSGRDLISGRPAGPRLPAALDAPAFVPVLYGGRSPTRQETLLAALNPDYFVNHVTQQIDPAVGIAEIVRYDGTLLMSTDPDMAPGLLREPFAGEAGMAEKEIGRFEETAGGRPALTAYRASRLYPLAVVVRLDREHALRHWWAEARMALAGVSLALFAFGALAFLFYRRQLQAIGQAAEAERLQRINATVFDASSEAILITDAGDRVISINPAFARVTGHAPDATAGRPLASLLTPEGARAYDALRRAATPGSGPPVIEAQLRCADGTAVWMEILSTPERDAPGGVAGYRRICRNINERKSAEAELERYRLRLEELVVERTTELAASRDAAEAANRAKSAFLANMSHELRTPLNAILGMSNLALRLATDPRQIDHLAKSIRASQHLLGLINDILDISRIEAQRLVLDDAPFSFVQIAQECLALHEESARAKGLEMVCRIDPRVPGVVCGDALRLKQILINFLGNAVKFSDSGTITLHARVEQESGDAVALRLEVSDEGIGIPRDQQARLFSAFSQVDDSMTRKFGGSGLGLFISRRLAVLMGGDAGVESEAGQGSTFWATVRLRRQAPDAAGTRGAAGDPCAATARRDLQREFAGTRILLAEDEPMNQEVLRLLLEDFGLRPVVVDNGRDAVARAALGDCALVLMDLQMPLMGGIEAARAIRALPGTERLSILALTASAYAEERAQCLAAGMDDHLAKPVDENVLAAALLCWLRSGCGGVRLPVYR